MTSSYECCNAALVLWSGTTVRQDVQEPSMECMLHRALVLMKMFPVHLPEVVTIHTEL